MEKYDITAIWHLNKFCNFRCKYCFLSLEELKNPANNGSGDISKVIDFFDGSNLKWRVHMCGGEPFLYPKFVELCAGLTKKHYISMNTNLTSSLIGDFVKKIDPRRVRFLSCSLHISTREKLNLKEAFIKKFKLLEQAGFNAYVTQVFHPEIIPEFNKTFEYFGNAGITINPTIFRGRHKGKHYPHAYTQEEASKILFFQRKIRKTNGRYHLHYEPSEEFTKGYLSFKGVPCSTGRKAVIIDQDGRIKRCYDEDTYLGNIFEGKLKLFDTNRVCSAEICRGYDIGLKHACGKFKTIPYPSYPTDDNDAGSSRTNYMEKFIYPHTTPILKPIRKILRELSHAGSQND